MLTDIEKMLPILDEVIEQKVELKKGLSFNPFNPTSVSFDTQMPYNPYKWVDNGFMPYEANFWDEQRPEAYQLDERNIAVRRRSEDAYLTTTKYYNDHYIKGMTGLMDLRKALDDDGIYKAQIPVQKKNAAPIGTVHTYNGVPHVKVAEGKWIPKPMMKQHKKQEAEKKKRIAAAQPQPTIHQKVEDNFKKVSKIKEAIESKKKQEFGEQVDDHLDQRDFQKSLEKKTKKRKPGKGAEVKLSEEELKYTLEKGKFALISAGKNPNADKDMTDEQIKNRDLLLQKELKAKGYMFTHCQGKYGAVEDSYLVMVHDADKDHIVKLGGALNQDSVIFAENGKQEMIYTSGENKGKKYLGQGWKEEVHAEDNYTEVECEDGKKIKFNLNFDFDNLSKSFKVAAILKVDGKTVETEFLGILAKSEDHAIARVKDRCYGALPNVSFLKLKAEKVSLGNPMGEE